MNIGTYTNGIYIYRILTIDTKDKIANDCVEALKLVNNDADIEEYIRAMNESVDHGLAYEIWKNNDRVGFMYNRTKDNLYIGSCLKVDGNEATILILTHVFKINPNAHKIVFAPHGNNLKKFMSIVNGSSIRAWHNGKGFVTIIKKDVVDRGEKIINYFGLKKLEE